jgi:hypothetical protein
MLKLRSRSRRLFQGLTVAGMVIAAVIVVAVADPSASPVQAAPAVDELFLLQLGADIDGEAAEDQFGYSVALSADGGTAIIGAPDNDSNGDNSGHARIYTWNSLTSAWVQQGADIDGEAAGDKSGESVALSADGGTAIIGAPDNDSNGDNSGHARIYTWNSLTSAWVQQGADIDGEAAGDKSGESVALSADGGTAIIGATGNDGTVVGSNSGHARIYTWNGAVWVQQGADIDGEAADDISGYSVALSADGGTAIIGAPFNDGTVVGSNSGHARIYTWNGAVWVQQGADIDGEAVGDRSGWSVALSADGGTAIIGAFYNDGNGADSGHARIYTWNGVVWVQQGADIDGEAAYDGFGFSVALSADGGTAIIGAPFNDSNGDGSGHAQIFTWDGARWVQRGADIDGEAAYDESGWSVALSADGGTAIIGALGNSGNGSGSGHARVVVSRSAVDIAPAEIVGEAAGDFSGHSVALSADGGTAIIGAPDNDSNGDKSGHARIYTWNGAGWVQQGADIDGESARDISGYSVALSADGGTAIIGAPGNDGVNRAESGHARIYTWNGRAWVQQGADIDGESAGDLSGWSVALSADGGTAIIGAHYNDGVNGADSGHARIYTWDGSAWVKQGADIDGEAPGDQFGRSVALSADGGIAIIGAPGNGSNGIRSGHARIYTWDSLTSVWVQQGADIDGEAADDGFGFSVALSADGGTAIIGAPYNNGNGFGSGQARIYTWDSLTSAWLKQGADIDGEAPGDQFGWSVALSADGGTAIIGANRNNGSGSRSGHARIYAWDSTDGWAQRGADLDGDDAGDSFGDSVALSADGSTAIIGATGVEGNASRSGYTRIYRFLRVSTPAMPNPVTVRWRYSSRAVVSWTPGLSYEYGPVTAWQVEQSRDGGVSWSTATLAATAGPAATTATVTGLTNGVEYRFRVAGINKVGTGPSAMSTQATPSTPSTPATPATPATDPDDLTPVVPADAGTKSVVPGRVLESRSGNGFVTVDGLFQGVGRSGVGVVREVKVTGRAGVPVDAAAVFLNVVAVDPSGAGYLTVYPCGMTRPVAANVNYNQGGVVANAVFAKIGDGGRVCVYSSTATDLVIDVNGFTLVGAGTKSVVPGRVLESRSGNGFVTVDGLFQGVGRSGVGVVREVKVTGRAGVPVDAAAVFLNVVAVDPSGAGYLTVYPCGMTRPVAANVNYNQGGVVANAVFAKIGDGGRMCVYSSTATDLVIDVSGYTPAS